MQLSKLVFFAAAAVGLTHGRDGYVGQYPNKHLRKPVSADVDLGYAKYKGTTLMSGVNQFLGMRFATPPLGNLRWRAPIDPEWIAGVQSAQKAYLLQLHSSLRCLVQFDPTCAGATNPVPGARSENCLYVNVWAPSNATTSAKLPVYIYISGGGYTSNYNANYNGTGLVVSSNRSVIVVNFNYRVAVLGFLAGEEVVKDGDLNVVLLDQRQLFKWVKQHIAEFGGDSEHIVIGGASAGAGSISYHLTAYGGRDDGPFAGAIAESNAWLTQNTVASSELDFQNFTVQMGCTGVTSVMTCLRSVDIVKIQTYINESIGTTGPTIDGTIWTDTQYNLWNDGMIVRVPIIFGNTNNEGNLFAPNLSTRAAFVAFVQSELPNLMDAQYQQVIDEYPLMGPFAKHASWFPSAASMLADAVFMCRTRVLLTSYARCVSPTKVWNYRFAVVGEIAQAAGLGTPHTFETFAVWGPGNADSLMSDFDGAGISFSTYNAPMVPIIQGYWISFVKSLDPNTFRAATAPAWEPFGCGVGDRIRLRTNDTGMETVPESQVTRCNVWNTLQ